MKEYKELVGMILMEVFQRGEDAIVTVCNCAVPSHVMLVEYLKLPRKLEDLPSEQKNELWEHAYKLFPTKNSEQRLKVCKIIHTIGELL